LTETLDEKPDNSLVFEHARNSLIAFCVYAAVFAFYAFVLNTDFSRSGPNSPYIDGKNSLGLLAWCVFYLGVPLLTLTLAVIVGPWWSLLLPVVPMLIVSPAIGCSAESPCSGEPIAIFWFLVIIPATLIGWVVSVIVYVSERNADRKAKQELESDLPRH
jgi:hypothetical protein